MARTYIVEDLNAVDALANWMCDHGKGADEFELTAPGPAGRDGIICLEPVNACFEVVKSKLSPGKECVKIRAEGWAKLREGTNAAAG